MEDNYLKQTTETLYTELKKQKNDFDTLSLMFQTLKQTAEEYKRRGREEVVTRLQELTKGNEYVHSFDIQAVIDITN